MAEAHPPNPDGADGTRTPSRGTARPIVSPRGAALIDGSHHLAPALNETLAHIRQLAGDDESIMPGEEMTSGRLAEDLESLLKRETLIGTLVPGTADHRQLVHIVATLPLSGRLGIKLAVVARDRTELYLHSLRVACCAGALAQRLHLARHEVAEAVAAGLFHDLGLLHVDPALLEPGLRLDPRQRHYLDVHPLTGYLILESESAWHPIVSTAVMEHHERMDGSGYPRGLSGSRLGELGQLLAVAELAASLLAPGPPALAWLRLGVVLRLNAEKLNRDFVHCMLAAVPRGEAPHAAAADLGGAIENMVDMAVAFERWKAIRTALPAAALTDFIGQRLDHLGRNLADAGIDLDFWQEIDADLEGDAISLNEICVTAREGLRQLIDIAEETRRRWTGHLPVVPLAAAWVEDIEGLSR